MRPTPMPLAAALLLASLGLATGQDSPQAAPDPATPPALDREVLAGVDRAVADAIKRKEIPGAVIWIERDGDRYVKAFGRRVTTPETEAEAMTIETVFDLASLTKVVATTPSVMLLIEQGKLRLSTPVSHVLPEFRGLDRSGITIRHLLTHTSGLAPVLPRDFDWTGCDNAIALACSEPLRSAPGEAFVYSDVNFILLGDIVRRASGLPLDQFAHGHLFSKLGMTRTTFRPAEAIRPDIAPTEMPADGTPLRGVVHDPAARQMGGVAGHAGLFSTAEDVARYARMLLAAGRADDSAVLAAESVEKMTTVHTPPSFKDRRGLGWDIASRYSGVRGDRFPIGSYGHTGWTGTSLWIDPHSGTFVILLTNRNHPTEKGKVKGLRHRVASLAAEAVATAGHDFANAPEPRTATKPVGPPLGRVTPPDVKNGIDVLVTQDFTPLNGLKVGLITNHTGRDRDGETTIDLLHRSGKVHLVALFSPEHGIRGEADESVTDGKDQKTGLPVYSLYAEGRRQPSPEQLEGLDALVFDVQDIGARFYTYISTMGLAMEAAAGKGLKFFVLDRVNPIGGLRIDGPVHMGERTFTGHHPIPVRHGMTVGELAQMFRAENQLDLELTVVPVSGWRRNMDYDDTGLPWINPSPNMRSLTAAFLYPGVALLEFTNFSVGRGTKRPFELVGAPYIKNAERFAAALRAYEIEGAAFVPVSFTPSSSVFKGERCGGVKIVLTNPASCPSVDIGMALALTLARFHGDSWESTNLNKLLAHAPTVEAIQIGLPIREIRQMWTADLFDFETRRKAHLLYHP